MTTTAWSSSGDQSTPTLTSTCPYREYNIWDGPVINLQTIFEDNSSGDLTLPFTYNYEGKRKRPKRKKISLDSCPFHHSCLCGHGDIIRSLTTQPASTADKWVTLHPPLNVRYSDRNL